ncbi:unnamed protein product [Gongylonema pulchrum]|uniref:FA_desaturase domain-containing protein n=1 Tax=Gongylonema pulchrum TaxID=637853 RepID=A0A183E1W4_9BILA|nr:unnamed protein product [Gongylonema pulchrum]
MFFAHMGWLLVRKHPEVKRKAYFRHYKKMVLMFWFIVPTFVPMLLWGESFVVAFYTCTLLRYCLALHGTWLINSAAHKYGYRPYNPNISPLAATAMGEGGHNYHHTFPQDYRTSEYVLHLNVTKLFIDFLILLGLAYDMKIVPQENRDDVLHRG